MRLIHVIHNRAIHFHPGMSFESPRLLAGAEAQLTVDSAPLEQPTEDEGSLETIRAKEKVTCGSILEPRYGTCGAPRSGAGSARMPNLLCGKPTKNTLPPAKAKYA